MIKLKTKYNYEKNWVDTNEKDLLRMIKEEIGDADVKGTLTYLVEATKKGKVVNLGSCGFKKVQRCFTFTFEFSNAPMITIATTTP